MPITLRCYIGELVCHRLTHMLVEATYCFESAHTFHAQYVLKHSVRHAIFSYYQKFAKDDFATIVTIHMQRLCCLPNASQFEPVECSDQIRRYTG